MGNIDRAWLAIMRECQNDRRVGRVRLRAVCRDPGKCHDEGVCHFVSQVERWGPPPPRLLTKSGQIRMDL